MRRRGVVAARLTIVAALAAGGPTAEQAAAQGTALTSDAAEPIALAGNQVVLKVRRQGELLRTFTLAGVPGPSRTTVLVPPASGDGFLSDIAASDSTVALIRGSETPSGADTGQVAYAGPLAGPLQALTASTPPGNPGTVESVHVSGPATLVQAIGRDVGSVFSVRVPGLPPVALPVFHNEVTDSAIAGDLVALALQSGQGDLSESSRRLVLYDWRSWRIVYDRRTPWGIMDLDVAPDGRVAASIDSRGQNIALLNRTGRARILTRQTRTSIAEPHFTGGDGMVALSVLNGGAGIQRVVRISARSGRVRALGPPTELVESLDADATSAAWIANGCALVTPVAGPAMRSIPQGPCLRREVMLAAPKTQLRRRTAFVDVYCLSSAAGPCRGIVRLLSRRHRAIASRRYVVKSGHRRRVALVVGRREVQRLRRAGSTDLVAATVVRDGYGHSARVLGVVPVRFPRR